MIQDSPPTRATAFLALQVQQRNLSQFFPLLQQGFMVQLPACGSLRTVLCGYLGLSQEYLEGRIQTIFLNGRPVDNMDVAMVGDGDTLALSAAMPGLVGATMRRGGFFASLRSGISHGAQDEMSAGGECQVKLKLFNLLTDELGPLFLAQGIWINQEVLAAFLKRQPEDFWAGLVTAELNDDVVEPRNLATMGGPDGDALVRLSVVGVS
jgi:hypothetical protein